MSIVARYMCEFDFGEWDEYLSVNQMILWNLFNVRRRVCCVWALIFSMYQFQS